MNGQTKTPLNLAQFEGHAPAPWKCEKVATQIGHAWKIGPFNACLYVDGRYFKVGDPKSEANARLLAAAPRLLSRVLASGGMAAVCVALDKFAKPSLPTARDWENAAVGDDLAAIVKAARATVREIGELP